MSPGTGGNLLRLKQVFLSVGALDPNLRASALDRECGGDVELRRAAEMLLLERGRAKGFLKRRTGIHSRRRTFEGNTRFEVRRKLGSGGFGDVYDAWDRDCEQSVALKVLHQFSPAAVYRFKREFRAVEGLSHPNLGQMYELLFDPESGCWLLVMELVHGVHFFKALPYPSPSETLLPLFSQLVHGVHALHCGGILHCDIKPSNVLVADCGKLVLLDFGLAKRLAPRSKTQTLLMGTPDYAAPEQIAGLTMTAATDWYSVGVMLYQALSGKLPFEGTPWQVMTQKQSQPPPPLSLEDSPLSGLADLSYRMLKGDPAARPEPSEILQRLSASQPPAASSQRIERLFVGREPELKSITEAFERAVSGTGTTVHLSGPSGIGKSALAHEAIHRLRLKHPGLLSFAGKCYEGESVPYKALDEVVEEIGKHLRRLPHVEADAILPRDFPNLAKLFPALEPAALRLRYGNAAPADSREQRQLAFGAFRELIARMADRHPTIVFIDDLQWGDLDSAQLLRHVMDHNRAAPVLLVLAYRSEDATVSEALQSLSEWDRSSAVQHISIGPLPDHESRQLTASLIASEAEEAISEIARESGGSPFFLQQLALYSKHRHGLPRLQDLIQERVRELPETARRFLEVLATARIPLKLAVLRQAASLGDRALATRSLLVAGSLIRTLGVFGEWCETYHDRIAESVGEMIVPSRRREYHEALAQALEGSGYEDAEAIAEHFHSAGRPADACRLTRIAANQALSALAFDRAARLYQRVLDWSEGGSLDPADRVQLERARGDALVNCGRGIEGARAYQRALIGVPPDKALELRIISAAHLMKGGDLAEGVKELGELLHENRLPLPQGRGAAIARLLLERARLRIRGLEPRTGYTPSSDDTARLEVCWAAATGFGLIDPISTEVFCTIYLRLALDAPSPRSLAIAFGSYASRLAYVDDGEQTEARALLRRAHKFAAEDPSPYVEAFLAYVEALIEVLSGNWSAASTLASRAIEIFRTRCSGAAWETTNARSALFSARAALGEWRANADESPILLRDADERGDRFSAVSLRLMTSFHTTYLINDEPDLGESAIGEIAALWPRQKVDLAKIYALESLVDLDLYRGWHEQAWQRVQAAWTDVSRTGMLRITLVRAIITEVRARAALAMAAKAQSPASKDEFLAIAEAIGDDLVRHQGAAYVRGLGFAILAGVAGVRGDESDERKRLLEAATHLEKGQMIPWLSVVRLRIAQLSTGEDARSFHASGMSWMNSQNIRKTECLVRMLFPYVS